MMIMRILKNLIIQGTLLLTLLSVVPAAYAAAIPCGSAGLTPKQQEQCGVCQASGKTVCDPGDSSGALGDTAKTVINLLSVIVGIAAIVMIILAGFKYITSAGDSNKITAAKNTLLYAIIGLVIVALAQTIAHFVLTEANTSCSGTVVNGTCQTK